MSKGLSASHHELMFFREEVQVIPFPSTVIPDVVYPLWGRAAISNDSRARLLTLWRESSRLEDGVKTRTSKSGL